MQITLNEAEILTALENYVRKQITISDGQTIAIDLKAGRGENGFSATLDIIDSDQKTTKPTPPKDVLVPRSEPKAAPKPAKVADPVMTDPTPTPTPNPASKRNIDPLVAEMENTTAPEVAEKPDLEDEPGSPEPGEEEEWIGGKEVPEEADTKPKSIFNFDKKA